MMRRGATAKFMPGAYVFPGGVLNEQDEGMGPGTQVCALRVRSELMLSYQHYRRLLKRLDCF